MPIVKFTTSKSDLEFGYVFCNWNYAIVSIALNPDFKSHDKSLFKNQTKTPSVDANWINAQDANSSGRNSYMNTGCNAMLIDQNWFKSQLPKAKILKMATPLKVRDIGTSKHKTDKYIVKTLYFSAINNKNQQVVACIRCELHLVDNLRANILIKNNIVGTKGIIINIAKEKAYVPGCKALLSLSAHQQG